MEVSGSNLVESLGVTSQFRLAVTTILHQKKEEKRGNLQGDSKITKSSLGTPNVQPSKGLCFSIEKKR
jgi:hypothetical protein